MNISVESFSLPNSVVFTIRILTALILGSCIGVERQRHSHPAGLRTNTLVSLGSALFVAIPYLTGGPSDPTRIAAQVVSGIGFLGAGVILREGLNVRGLNTAATLWCSSAIGVLAGSGLVLEATIGTAGITFVNIAMRPLAKMIPQPAEIADQDFAYTLKILCHRKKESRIRTIFLHLITTDTNLMLQGLTSQQNDMPDQALVTGMLISHSKNHRLMEELLAKISLEDGVISASWEIGSNHVS